MLAFLLLLLALPALLPCAYLLLLTLLSWKPQAQPRSSRKLRFDVIVPAHNEAGGIADAVASLRQLDWPTESYRILVVADNCSDDTAAIARAAGAQVLERFDTSLRGKGYALSYAFKSILAESRTDAVVIVDADSAASPNLLEACATRIEQGALAVQVHHGVRNAGDSWRTRLMSVAFSAIHVVRSRARERMGLSCGIRGNGWCLHRDVLTRVPYAAFSLAEDIEYGIELGLAGIRVYYADEAAVLGDMVSGGTGAETQRQRWEGGRLKLIREKLPALLAAAFKRPSKVCLDLAVDLLVAPLSYVALGAVLYGVVAAAALFVHASPIWLYLALAGLAGVVVYVMRGWQVSGTGLQGLLDLGRAPFYLGWKILLLVKRKSSGEWVRTERETKRP